MSVRAETALDKLRVKAREPHRGWVHVDDIEAILAQVNEYEQRLRALENIARQLNEALPKGDDWKDAMAVGYKLSGRKVLGLGYALEALHGLHGVDEHWASALLAPAAAPAVSSAAAGGAETEQP